MTKYIMPFLGLVALLACRGKQEGEKSIEKEIVEVKKETTLPIMDSIPQEPKLKTFQGLAARAPDAQQQRVALGLP